MKFEDFDSDARMFDELLNSIDRWGRILLLVIALTLAGVVASFAHGNAFWIEANPSTAYCCGPDDCRPIPDEAVTMTSEGYHVAWDGQVYTFAYRSPDVHASIDQQFWFCNYHTDLGEPLTFCLFVPA
tara:strand:+ start:431 stop:814 length:384 start_codon:yes stop_codon:yes gene_type:complete